MVYNCHQHTANKMDLAKKSGRCGYPESVILPGAAHSPKSPRRHLGIRAFQVPQRCRQAAMAENHSLSLKRTVTMQMGKTREVAMCRQRIHPIRLFLLLGNTEIQRRQAVFCHL